MSIVSIRSIVKRYGKVEALKGISFTVERGEILALLGPNGSGKTTTLEILMGIRKQDEGEVGFFGPDGRSAHGVKVGAVFQSPVYYDNLTARELIDYYRSFYRNPSGDIDRYLGMVNLQDKLDSQFGNLSGGQKQQLSIVLALVNDPDLLFFDEPTSALDPQVRLQLWDLVRKLKQEGKTIVFTTHYIEEAEALADRVSILSAGRILVTDRPARIIREYNDNFSVELSFDEPVSPASFDRFDIGDVIERDGVYSFSVPAIDADLLQAVRELSGQFDISRINIGKSSLQSVFVRITEDQDVK